MKRDWNVECVQHDVFRNFVTRVENVHKEIRSGIMLCHVCLGGGGGTVSETEKIVALRKRMLHERGCVYEML